jgi:hypothetical protein
MDVEKIPHWLRWILIPIVSILAMIFLNVLLELPINYIGFGDGLYGSVQRNTINAAAVGFIAIYAGVYVAPNRKEIVSLILGALYVLLGSMSVWIGISKSDYWIIINIISSIFGIGVAIYITFMKIKL